MNEHRAREIVSTAHMIDVTYNGSQVYLEKVNEGNKTCTIHYLHKPGEKFDVSLASLLEH